MDFIDKLQVLSKKIASVKDVIKTEEATKTSLVLPFIAALGYDYTDPHEVIPEFVADHGIKQGEKVDYAIAKEGKVIILIECKPCNANLDIQHESQLYRYFSVTETRIAILTNGIVYKVYSDITEKNKMDDKPFLEIDMLNLQEGLVAELKRLTKTSFNLVELVTVAEELKYLREIKSMLGQEFANPTEDFIDYFIRKVYPGRVTQNIRERFTSIIRRAFQTFITDSISEKLRIIDAPKTEVIAETSPMPSEKPKVETTEDEILGHRIVMAIASSIIDPERVFMRDTQSYCGILLDDNNRKPICRLYVEGKRKSLGIFDNDRREHVEPIEKISDIYKYAEQIRRIIGVYDNPTK